MTFVPTQTDIQAYDAGVPACELVQGRVGGRRYVSVLQHLYQVGDTALSRKAAKAAEWTEGAR